MTPETTVRPTEPGDVRRNPYVGPVPVREPPLYGRKKETDELADLVVSKRIVLLFGPSGAGKTSLIQAALIPRLHDRYRLNALPPVRLTHRSEALAGRTGVNHYVWSTMRSLEQRFPREQQLSDTELAELTLANYFARRVNSGGDAAAREFSLLVLDQFEELFTLDRLDWEAKKAYLAELGKVLAGSGEATAQVDDREPVKPWALISMREDRVAEVQPFLYLIPTALAFRFRLDPLERDEALEAVMKPAGTYIAPEAAVQLVDDLRTLRLQTPDGTEFERQGRFVEPVQLQVVCRRLWDKVVAGEKRRIEVADVTSGSGTSEVDRALRDYFDTEVERAAQTAQVSQRNLRDWIEGHLITANGVRAQALRMPAVLGTLDEAIGSLIDANLIRSDVRSDQEWIELAHDRLVDPIVDGNKAWRDRNLQLFQRQAKLWAAAGKVHGELLFVREELSDAERFASEHPDELNDDERQFLAESGRERDRIVKDKWLGWIGFGVVTVTALLALALVAYQRNYMNLLAKYNTNLDVLAEQEADQIERSKLYRAVGAVRDKPRMEAVARLLDAHDEISRREIARGERDNLSNFFDSTLLETLRTVPRSIDRVVGQHGHIVRSLAFKGDGHRLISGSWDGTISIWRPDQPGIREFGTDDQGAETYAVALHDRTGVLASTYIDGRIILWRLAEGGLQRLSVLDAGRTGYHRQVTTAAFNRDGTLLATAGWDKTILLWDVANPAVPKQVASFGKDYHQAPMHRILFLPPGANGERLASTDLDGKIRIWRIPSRPAGAPAEPRPERDFAVSDALGRNVGLYSAAASPDGRFLVAGDSEGYVHIWDLLASDSRTSGVRLTAARHGSDDYNTEIYDIAFSPLNAREFVSVGVDGVLLKWTVSGEPRTAAELKRNIDVLRVGHMGERLYSVSYHPTRAGIVAVGGTRTVQLVDTARRGSQLATALVPGDQTTGTWRGVSMDRASSTIAAMREDNRIYFWRHTPGGIVSIPNWTIAVAAGTMFALDAKGSTVATVACGGNIALWELVDGQAPTPKLLPPRAPPADSSCPDAAPSFNQEASLFAAAFGSRLEIWSRSANGNWELQFAGEIDAGDSATGGAPTGARETISSLAFSAISHMAAVGSSSGRIRLLEINGGKPASSFLPVSVDAGKDVLALAFKPNASLLVSGGEDGFIIEWSLPALKKERLDTRHERSVTSLAFAVLDEGMSKQRPVFVSADREGNVREWTSGSTEGATLQIAPASHHPVRGIALRSDGLFLVTAGDELLAWNFSRESMIQAAKQLIAKR
ncbi:MAG TPA: AAA family ATPase [Casimicrobiaceae bacterium]|nr:AAA family ATPase [Casimicrobiaceae bacterium]